MKNDIVTEIKMLHSKGYHVSEIAKKLKCDILLVYSTVVENKASKIVTEEERETMIALRGRGYSYSQIAHEVGRSKTCVMKRIESPAKYHGFIGNELNEKTINKIYTLYKNGRTAVYISKTLGLTIFTVRYRLNKYKISPEELASSYKVSIIERAKVKGMKKNGAKLSEITRDTGWRIDTIKWILSK